MKPEELRERIEAAAPWWHSIELAPGIVTPGRKTPEILRGEVAAILTWRREDGDEEYHHLLRRDEWEVVLPELVFAAGAEAVNVDQKGS